MVRQDALHACSCVFWIAAQISRLATDSAFSWRNSRLGSTSSPISVKTGFPRQITSLTLTCKNERTKRSAISPMFMVRLHFLAVLFLTTVRTVDRHRARNQVFQSGPSSTM
ncbi:hypothetical protein NKH81_18720 [Mesorhizobium sp. M0959]|uniref:hypothetical protein n=1 Tax=Mesorhizobium sp. M0959 TaxID=2957034 RepID=UPI0033382DD1